MIDLGLRLEDVEGLELESEPVTYKQKKDPREYLWDCGATEEECEFLVHDDEGHYYDEGHRSSWAGERVELNAMDTPQFMGWLEAKLAEHGVTKVRPDGDTFRDAYRRAVLLQAFERKLETAKAGFYEEELPPLPDDLEARIGARLREDPKLSWDAALWEEARAAATGPDGERG